MKKRMQEIASRFNRSQSSFREEKKTLELLSLKLSGQDIINEASISLLPEEDIGKKINEIKESIGKIKSSIIAQKGEMKEIFEESRKKSAVYPKNLAHMLCIYVSNLDNRMTSDDLSSISKNRIFKLLKIFQMRDICKYCNVYQQSKIPLLPDENHGKSAKNNPYFMLPLSLVNLGKELIPVVNHIPLKTLAITLYNKIQNTHQKREFQQGV